METDFHRLPMNREAQMMLNEPNAGGASTISEVLSLLTLRKLVRARLLNTEMGIIYFPFGSKKTDYSIVAQGRNGITHRLGVSVTRAMHFRGNAFFTREHARSLLIKKLFGIIVSTENVVDRHRWEKQILHIWAPTKRIAKMVRAEYRHLKSDIRSNTIVIVTVARGKYGDALFNEGSNLGMITNY
eukprot:gb/GECH01006931.1/.p1 GENE.gb/GECH01006931.1/~~gb/GECH01006931.1/.p1  ORF type:complete len:186 (+),score=38.43 gb/GECH01006931.1/:1-558(+)